MVEILNSSLIYVSKLWVGPGYPVKRLGSNPKNEVIFLVTPPSPCPIILPPLCLSDHLFTVPFGSACPGGLSLFPPPVPPTPLAPQ